LEPSIFALRRGPKYILFESNEDGLQQSMRLEDQENSVVFPSLLK